MANHLFSLPSKACQKQGPSLHRHCPISTVLCPSPTPAPESVISVAGHDPASGTGLPRYPSSLSGMLSPIPRWIKTGGSGYVPVLLRPSPNIGRVGIHNFPFGACSGFTRVTGLPDRCSPSRLTFFPRASAGWFPIPTAWVATGMNRQFPGRNSHPLATCALVAHPYLVVCRGEGC